MIKRQPGSRYATELRYMQVEIDICYIVQVAEQVGTLLEVSEAMQQLNFLKLKFNFSDTNEVNVKIAKSLFSSQSEEFLIESSQSDV